MSQNGHDVVILDYIVLHPAKGAFVGSEKMERCDERLEVTSLYGLSR